MSSGRIKTLDGVRGIAILLVLAGHVAQNYAGIDPATRTWLMAFANSNAGVRLFFVLSGYLITSLLIREQNKTNSISLRQFYWRRILRIFPAFYCYLAVVLLLDRWHGSSIPTGSWIAAGSFTWNYRILWNPTPREIWVLGHLWTLALEQQFYLLWPIVLLLFGSTRGLVFAIAIIVWCPLARVVSYVYLPTERGYLGMMLHTSLDSIMVGSAAALLSSGEHARAWIASRSTVWLMIAAGWLLIGSPVLSTVVRGSPIVIGFTIDAVAAAWLILSFHLGARHKLHDLVGQGALPALGLISYSLYLWQQLFLSPAALVGPKSTAISLAAAIAVAAASFWLIEQPALRLKVRQQVRAVDLAKAH